MGTPAVLRINIVGDGSKATREMDQVSARAQTMGQRMKGAGAAMAGAFAGAAAIAGIRNVINATVSLSETQNKVAVIFGNSARQVEAFGDRAAAALGQSKKDALDAAATFATFGKSAGLTGDRLVGFSTDLTKLASDLASFHNTTPQDAIQALGAALRGESEPIRRYGVLLDDASLRQEALRQGLVRTTTQALTPQQKVLAAQALILKQTSDAQNDFARTSDSLANKQRILTAQWENAKAQLGAALVPVLQQVAGVLAGIAPWIERHSAIIGPLVVALGAWAIAQWALNIAMAANPIGLVVLALGALVAAVIVAYQTFRPFRDAVSAGFDLIRAAAESFMRSVREGIRRLQPELAQLRDGFDRLWIKLQPLVRELEPWARRLGAFLGGMFVAQLKATINVISSVVQTITTLIDKVSALINWLGRIHWPSPPSWLSRILPGALSASAVPALAGTLAAAGPTSAGRVAATALGPAVTALVLPQVRVYIGQTELTDLVRVVVDREQTTLTRRIQARRLR